MKVNRSSSDFRQRFQISSNTILLIQLQADRFIDRKLDQAENALKKKGNAGRKWYSNLVGDKNGCKLNEFHIFTISFIAGLALGVGSGA